MMRLNRQSDQLSRQTMEAAWPTAFVRLRTSTDTCSCGRLEAPQPARPLSHCLGTCSRQRPTADESVLFWSRRPVAGARYRHPAPSARPRTGCKRVEHSLGVRARDYWYVLRAAPSPRTSSNAARIATSSARALLNTAPAGVRTSLSSPEGRMIKTPPPPAVTPPSADPSLQIQTTWAGGVAKYPSAAARQTSS